MKTRTQTRNVSTHGIGETTSFSIATNGKAFRSLIDSVYTDKVTTPIRELMTNAFDSHSAAGKGDEPFTVFVPTNRDLRFAVRDYGTGMDHETVTNLYTTLFASSKEDTNDEVGQLGLGSKSPFAYTDTFTVTAFDGATKRVYTAFMASDLPQLALLHEGDSDEPQGILVEFPVKYQDVSDFQR
jgi:DNA topoisomerase VI subunit B